MQRLDMNIPLLIGGATTSKTHTAVKIEPAYKNNAAIYVADASRAVGVMGTLLGDDKVSYIADIREQYIKAREVHERGQNKKKRLDILQARANAFKVDFSNYTPPKPTFIGTKTFEDYDLEKVRACIDWTPFFATWELKGRYPAILDSIIYGQAARDLYKDAQVMLDKIIQGKWVTARATVGFWPVERHGDDIKLFTDESREKELAVFHTLRQQMVKSAGRPNYALSDFIAPTDDYIGGFCVTAGLGEDGRAETFKQAGDDYNAILFQALTDRLAEAMAEHMHERVRREFWGYETGNKFNSEEMIAEKYRGIRPAPGYPAQPDHTEKTTLFKLLGGKAATGVKLTEGFAMWPASSVSGLYLSHPESLYFGVGKIERDQVEDYAKRKGISLLEAQRWLAPILNYNP